MRFPVSSTDPIEGFRVQVARTGSGADAIFEAKGRMAMSGQFDSGTLPATETFAAPNFSMVAVVNADGAGAAIASFEDMALHLANVDGDLSDGDQSFNLGSYQFTLTDKTYFNLFGAEEWAEKGSVTAATYINTSGANVRSGWGVDGPLFTGGPSFFDCFESAPGCDFDDDGSAEIPGMSLPSGYFLSTCFDAMADPPAADCTAFISALFQGELFGLAPVNSPGPEPAGDFRMVAIEAAVQFTTVWPDGEDATTTFTIPTAP